MIAHVRRVSLFVAFVVAAVSAWTTTADAAPGVTAAPQVTVTGVGLSSTTDLDVYGTATCGQSGGQADLFVSGVQLFDWVYGATTTTVSCGTGPVNWHVTVTTYPGWRSPDWLVVNAVLTDTAGDATHSTNFYL